MGHSGDGCVLASTLCKYGLRKGYLFVLSWARVRRVRRGSISSELLVCGGGVRSILLLPLVARCIETIDVCIWRMFVFMSVVVSFCLPHPVAVSAFMICRGLCACTEMLWMCVLYVSFGSKVRPRTFGCVAMGSALLFIVRSRLLVYSAGSGVNRVQVVLSGFSKRLFCFVQAKTLCRYGCMYFLAALVLVCVDVIVMSSA